MKTKKNAAQLLLECLLEQKAELVFGVPGESFLPLLDALHDSPLRFCNTRNETGASFMAEAYGKLTGKPGVCLVTRGPGATYAAAGIHTARHNSTPLVLLIGQAERDSLERAAFQEIDYKRFYGDEIKWSAEIHDPQRLPEIIARAYATAMQGRPGPVVVSLPEDMLYEEVDAQISAAAATQFCSPAPKPSGLAKAMEILEGAKTPLLFAGGGGWDEEARQSLRAFAEANSLPVVVSFRRHDLMDNHSACYAGDAGVGMSDGMRRAFRDADVILALGVRFGEISTDNYRLLKCPVPSQRLIHVHSSSGELGKVYQGELAIHASPKSFLEAVAGRNLKGDPGARKSWCGQLREGFLARLDCPEQPGRLDMGVVTSWLREHLPNDVIVTNGAGNFAAWPNKFLLYGEKARLLAPQSGIMGYGLPAAIAAKLLNPGRLVVCFAGDGDLQMTSQEMASAAQLGAAPVILLLRNDMYGTIRMHQERRFPGRVSGTKIENPDFVALARAYGFHAERIEETNAFEAAFERACASKSGALLELVVDQEGVTPFERLREGGGLVEG